MNMLTAFFSSLLPSFERNRISEDIDLLRKELTDNTLPALKTATKVMEGKTFASPQTVAFNELFIQAMPQYRREGFVVGSLHFFVDLPAKLDVLDAMVLEMFAKDVTKDTITFRKASIIQYLEAVRFATKYATHSLLRHLALETNATLKSQEEETLSPAEKAWLDNNQAGYFQTLKILAQHPKDLKQLLEEIPDVSVIPEKYEVMRQTIGAHRLDPLKMGLVAPHANPIYHLRMVYTEWQVKNYQSQVEEKRLLELRLLNLKEAYQGKRDARLGQLIEYSEGRVQNLQAKIRKMEEQAG